MPFLTDFLKPLIEVNAAEQIIINSAFIIVPAAMILFLNPHANRKSSNASEGFSSAMQRVIRITFIRNLALIVGLILTGFLPLIFWTFFLLLTFLSLSFHPIHV